MTNRIPVPHSAAVTPVPVSVSHLPKGSAKTQSSFHSRQSVVVRVGERPLPSLVVTPDTATMATLATNGTTRTNFTIARLSAFYPACLMTIGSPSSRIGGVLRMIRRRSNWWQWQWRLTVTACDGSGITLVRPLVACGGAIVASTEAVVAVGGLQSAPISTHAGVGGDTGVG